MAVPQILAATFTVAFEGLMMFQGKDGVRSQVKIVAAPYHDNPSITICHKGLNNVYQCDPLIKLVQNDLVKFDPTGPAIPQPLYLSWGHVPTLRAFIVEGEIDPNAGLASVALPPGKLTTWKTFKDPVLLNKLNGAEVKCFARYVVLAATTTTAASLTIQHAQLPSDPPYTLMNDDLVFVSNTSMDGNHEHFPLYKSLLKAGGKLGDSKVLHETTCNSINDGVGHTPIDAALAAHNKDDTKNPHGDCGPVDNGG